MATETMRKARTHESTAAETRPERRTAPRRRANRKPKSRLITTPEQRHEMIAVAAYHKAEHRGFSDGDPEQDWFEAEAEIDATLAKTR